MKEITNRSWRALWSIAIAALVLSLVLAVAFLITLTRLIRIQTQASTFLTRLSSAVSEVRQGTFDYTVQFDQPMPVKGELPINFTIDVPIQTTLPVDTRVSVPVEIPLVGTVNLSIPIRAEVPVDLTVQVPITQTIPLDLSLPVVLDVPIRIRVADTPLAKNLEDLQLALDGMAGSLAGVMP